MTIENMIEKSLSLIDAQPDFSPDQKELTRQSVAILMSPENVAIMDEQVGAPLPDETLEEYLDRAKAVVFQMLDLSFGRS